MKIAVYDPLAGECKNLIYCLMQYREAENLDYVILVYQDAEKLKADYLNGTGFQLLWSEADRGGMELAEWLREQKYHGGILFCTAAKEYALRAFGVQAEGYLLKPYGYGDFLESLYFAKYRMTESRREISFISGRQTCRLALQDMLMIEIEGKNCVVHTLYEKFYTRRGIESFAGELQTCPSFLRMGKSFLINMSRISSFDREWIIFENGLKVPLPVRNKSRYLQSLHHFVQENRKTNIP